MLTLSAAETVGKNLKQGATVVLESTVYPGVTEEIVAPINFRTGIKDELRYCIDESIYIRNAIGKEVGRLTK